MSAAPVGLIGLGRIGGQLARNLLAAGLDVLGFDIVAKPEFIAAGGKFLRSPGEIADQTHDHPAVAARCCGAQPRCR